MPKITLHLLSAQQVERLQSISKDQMYNDGGGLYLFVRKYGTKEWILRYTSPLTNQRRKQSLGSYPDTSLKEARRISSLKREILAKGNDPIVETERFIKAEAKELAEKVDRQRSTTQAVFCEWKKAELQNRNDKGIEIERAFTKDVFPVIGKKPVDEVTRTDIKIILDRLIKRKAKRMANRLLSDLKQFFGYLDDEELITKDPTRRLIKDRTGGKEKSRTRFLSEEEIKSLYPKLQQSGIKSEYLHAIWLLLATGCRVNEILRAKWEHVDFKAKLLQIPVEHSKNKTKHTVYLSDFALTHLLAIYKTKTTDWLIPNRTGNGPITRQVLTKQLTDRQQSKKLKGRSGNIDGLAMPGGRWVIHDLRRTAGTIMQENGIMPHIIKKCLNQKTEDKIIETYQRADLQQQQKDAFNKLGEYLAGLRNL